MTALRAREVLIPAMRGTMTRSVGKSGTVLALLSLLALAGCESFGRGVTQAVLEGTGEPTEDKRSCEIEGRPFTGIAPYLAAQEKLPPFGEGVGDRPEVKVLYVHGIGTHVPGDGTTSAPDPGQGAGARHPRAAAEADRDRQPELPEPEPGRDQRHAADRCAAPAGSPVLRADLVADHPAGQGSDRVRQGAGLRHAPGGGEPGDAQLRQRRGTRSAGLCGPEARADPGRGHPVDLLDGLTQLE